MEIGECQEKALVVFRSLLQLFEKEKIEYFILAGSALGAVRHKGFIPWDDDIDIGIFYADVGRFELVIDKYLPDEYEYINYTNNDKYPRLHGKILYNGRCCVDIFPVVKAADTCIGRKVQWLIRKITWKLYSRKVGYVHEKENILLRCLSVPLALLVSKKMIIKIADWNCRRYENRESQYYCNIYSTYSLEKELIYAGCIEKLKLVSFEGLNVYSVGDIDKYLTHLYGDYMVLPPEEERKQIHDELFQ